MCNEISAFSSRLKANPGAADGLEQSSRLNRTNFSVEPVSCSLVDFLVSTFALASLPYSWRDELVKRENILAS